jgi:hypothetical protein
MPDQSIRQAFSALMDSGVGYLWWVLMSVWGGTAAYVGRLKRSGQRFSLVELVGEWSISGFSGMVTAYICQSSGFSFYVTAAAAGIAGHMGGRLIFLMERALSRYIERRFGIKPESMDVVE